MICGPTNSFRSHFAGSVPGMVSGHRPQKWTTSGRTAETGQSSQIAAISRVFVIPATAARRWRKCGKSETLCVSAGDDNRRDAQAHRRVGRASAPSPCTLPPGQKSLAGCLHDRRRSFVREIFPTGIPGKHGGGVCQTLTHQ